MKPTEATKAGDLHKLARFVSAVFADSSFSLDMDSHPETKELAIELGIAEEVLQNRFVEDDEADVAYTLAQWVRDLAAPPAEPASAAEGATVLSDDERAELCDFCIWLGERQDDPGTRRRLGRIAQIFNVTAVPDPAQSDSAAEGAARTPSLREALKATNKGRIAKGNLGSPDPAQSADTLCPNCVSPYKCNGPHIGETPPTGYEDADTPSEDSLDDAPLRGYCREPIRGVYSSDAPSDAIGHSHLPCEGYVVGCSACKEAYAKWTESASRPQPARGEVSEAEVEAGKTREGG